MLFQSRPLPAAASRSPRRSKSILFLMNLIYNRCLWVPAAAGRSLQLAPTPAPTRSPARGFSYLLAFGDSVGVGIPFSTGRLPPHNRQCLCFLIGWVPAILWWLASRFPRDAYPHTMVSTCFFLVAGVWPFCGGGQSVFHGTPTPTE